MDSTAETGTRIPAAMSGVFAVMSGVRRRNIWSSFFLVSGPGQSLRKTVRGPTAVQVFRKTRFLSAAGGRAAKRTSEFLARNRGQSPHDSVVMSPPQRGKMR